MISTLGLGLSAAPASAEHLATRGLPAILSPAQQSAYRAIFSALHAGQFDAAASQLASQPACALTNVARAELYLAKNSPVVDASSLTDLLNKAPELPESASLAHLATTRGAIGLPYIPSEHEVTYLGTAPRRGHVQAADDSARVGLARPILAFIKNDQPMQAEAFLDANSATLPLDTLTEMQQRIAWSYYLTGFDTSARALAAKAHNGSGEWSPQADWVSGLAAWRMKDYDQAASMFLSTAQRASNPELIAAGYFWAARAAINAGAPHAVTQYLKLAAARSETFYGMLAEAQLGLRPVAEQDVSAARIPNVLQLPNVRAALALAEIGESKLADQLFRHQARIGDARDHATLALLAGKIDMPETQLWLAHNGPVGATASVAARYPTPNRWYPNNGWTVDRSLVYAHILEESRFQVNATSHAGAKGLMQVMPGTARVIAQRRGLALGSLYDPSTNLAFGQIVLEKFRDAPETGGYLPKVIASFNAGTTPIGVWNTKGQDGSDPLLYIESIPYWETRAYVTTVLRNYWMYEQQNGEATHSLHALAQGLWPRFPGLPGPKAVRLAANPNAINTTPNSANMNSPLNTAPQPAAINAPFNGNTALSNQSVFTADQ